MSFAETKPTAEGARAHRQPKDPGVLLADALSVNALFSGGCGLLLLAGAPRLAGPLGVPAWGLAGLGVGLLAFAGALLWLLTQPRRLAAGGRAVLAADLAWVAGAALLLAGVPWALTTPAAVALAVVTGVVAMIAGGQAAGLRRRRGRHATGVRRLTVQAERVIAAPPQRVWAAVADAGGYARHTTTITSSQIVSGHGEGMVRVCTDQRGGRWSETCTLWEEGRRYRMTVDVETYPWYYRVLLDGLEQTWSLAPAGDGTRLTLTFDAALKLGVLGVVAGRVLARRAGIEQILDAYERELSPARDGEADAVVTPGSRPEA